MSAKTRKTTTDKIEDTKDDKKEERTEKVSNTQDDGNNDDVYQDIDDPELEL